MPSRTTARGTKRQTKQQRSAAICQGWETRRANEAMTQRICQAAALKRQRQEKIGMYPNRRILHRSEFGRADQQMKAGDSSEVPADVPHSVLCRVPGRAIVHYVVDRNKPLFSWL